MTRSAKAAGWGAVACLVLFLLTIAAALAGEGRWWSFPVFLFAVAAGILMVALTLAWGAAWVREANAGEGP